MPFLDDIPVAVALLERHADTLRSLNDSLLLSESQKNVTAIVDVLVVSDVVGKLTLTRPIEFTYSIQTSVLILLHHLNLTHLGATLFFLALSFTLGIFSVETFPSDTLLLLVSLTANNQLVKDVIVITEDLEVGILLHTLLQPVTLQATVNEHEFLPESLAELLLIVRGLEVLIKLGGKATVDTCQIAQLIRITNPPTS